MEKNNKNIKWICVLIFAIITAFMSYSIILRILMRYGMMMISFLGVSLIIYFFFYDAILQKCKVCRKLKSLICACIISALCIFAYTQIHKPPTAVRMKENILYIQPKSELQKDPNDIYDGTENDPNLKQNDEGTIQMKEDILYVHPKLDTINKK